MRLRRSFATVNLTVASSTLTSQEQSLASTLHHCHCTAVIDTATRRMASRVLKQLGEKAFQPLKVGDIWHKPAISAKNFAKLKRQTVAEGRSVARAFLTAFRQDNCCSSCCSVFDDFEVQMALQTVGV